MSTTELYSGYSTEGKPSSRVLRPPGGGSSNIFGTAEPAPAQPARQAAQAPASQPGSNPTTDAQQQYQKNKPSGKGEAPFASFAESGKSSAPTQFDNCGAESQKDADFRCYSVTEYRNAVVQNAAVRQRAQGQAMGTINPITHQEYQESAPCHDFDQRRVHPQQVAQQQQQQAPIRMVRGQNNHNVGKVKYNPITGEEYPADYGQNVTEDKKEEQDENDNAENADKQNDTTDETDSSTEKQATPAAPVAQSEPAPFQKVRQPPGGKSSGLW